MKQSYLYRCLAIFLLFLMLLAGIFVSSASRMDAFAQGAMQVNRTGILSATGYDYVLQMDQIGFQNMTMSTNDDRWVIKEDYLPGVPNGTSLIWNENLTAGEYDLPDFTLRFSDCVDAYDNGSYDLIATFSKIHVGHNVDMGRPVVLCAWYADELWYSATNQSFGRVDTKYEVTYQIVKHGTDTPVAGAMLLGFTDMDVTNKDGTYEGRPEDTYREGISIKSGGLGDAWVEPDTCLEIMDNGTTFAGTMSTGGLANEKRSGVSFLGDASGTTVLWGGTGCYTQMVMDMDALWPEYMITPSSEGPGIISPDVPVTATQGQRKEFLMTPAVGAHIEEVLVDGSAIPVTDPNGMVHVFENIQADHRIHVKFAVSSYVVRYDENKDFNPDHLEGEQTQNTVTSVSGMPDSVYQYGQRGSLRKNDFIREGYAFIGWNTEKDGSGTFYPDQYDQVYNLTTEHNGVVTLYAQWEKQLGTETITVVSEETGNPVSGVSMELYRKVNGTWVDTGISGQTDQDGQVMVGDLHWFDYEWRSLTVPAGYETMADTDYSIRYDQLSQTNSVILYLKRTTIVCDSQVSNVINGENPPAFLYRISGTDAAGVEHTYHLMVQTDGTGNGSNALSDVLAGTYRITQIPVQRYRPLDAKNVLHATPSGPSATVDVLHHEKAEVLFPYALSQYGGFSHTDSADNGLES